MSKSVMIIDTPRDCCECPFGTIVFGKGVCLLDEGNGIECPLKPYKDFVPIEWIEKKAQEFLMNRNFRWATDFQEVVDMWKVENNIPLFDGELKITLEKENEHKESD